MGVAHVSQRMINNIERNSGEKIPPVARVQTVAAGLLHDIGHGPFSHTLEEVLVSLKVSFSHERMTRRIIEEDGTAVNRLLKRIGPSWPKNISEFISKKRKTEKWWHKIISSQLDADRLDYIIRDMQVAGVVGHGFDFSRLLDFLTVVGKSRIGVDERAVEAVEAYLLSLDHGYRAIYYHHAVRAASALLSSIFGRAAYIYKNGRKAIFPRIQGEIHPLASLLEKGDDVPMRDYLRLGEFHFWTLVEGWTLDKDQILSKLSRNLLGRNLPKTVAVKAVDVVKFNNFDLAAKEFVQKKLKLANLEEASFYCTSDHPGRVTYAQYDWNPESPEDSIWIVRKNGNPIPLEGFKESKIADMLAEKRYSHRAIVSASCREGVQKLALEMKVEA